MSRRNLYLIIFLFRIIYVFSSLVGVILDGDLLLYIGI